LQSPTLIGHQQEQEARIQLETQIRQKLTDRCTLSQLLRLMSRQDKSYHCPRLLEVLLELANLARAHRFETPAEWVRLFEEQLNSLGWLQNQHLLETTQASLLQGWKALLKCFSSYHSNLRKIDRATALARLRTLCQKSTLAEPFDPTLQVSLYNLNDAVGLEFTHIWLSGFDDRSQPAAASPSPFIPHKLQRDAAIPGSHSDVQLKLARQSFHTICRSTGGEIHASYHQQDGDENLRASSLLSGFREVRTDHSKPVFLNRLAEGACDTVELDNLRLDNSAELTTQETLKGGQAIFSDQSSCPFRAFANHRLNCRPLEPINNGLDARSRGTALHIALERLFTMVSSQQQLLALTGLQAQDLISQCSDAAIEYLVSQNPELMTPRFSSLERQRLQKLLSAYLELEKERPVFEVLAAEKTVSWRQQQLQVNLKIDRIDRLDDGTLGIIDYKTGKYVPSVGRLAEERPENLQLPLYHSAAAGSLGDTVSAIAIAQINAENVCFHGLAASDNFHSAVKPVSSRSEFDQDWHTLTDEWRLLLARLATDFIQGVALVDPVNGEKTCEYCRLQPLCRVREVRPSHEYQDQENGELD
ncbi:MAG: PD-(D/E)XK nuclease family protein, partial [Gammaproteobacteria bacterium]|nr:PD-(D/E)XK nuclease family protein [Gammaproteobacteria bacterium]